MSSTVVTTHAEELFLTGKLCSFSYVGLEGRDDGPRCENMAAWAAV